MSRKSRPRSPFLQYVMGSAANAPSLKAVPNCTTCRGARTAVDKEAIPADIWANDLAPLWDMMQQSGQTPKQIAYCSKCDEYGILGGWQSF